MFVTHSQSWTIWSLFTLLHGKLNLNEFVRNSIVFHQKKEIYCQSSWFEKPGYGFNIFLVQSLMNFTYPIMDVCCFNCGIQSN